jgi:hypothetical protein
VRAVRGFIWGRLHGRGARVFKRIGESHGDHARNGIVFITASGEGMTCGALLSAVEGEGKRYRFGGGRKWAVGRFGIQAEVLPPALFLF